MATRSRWLNQRLAFYDNVTQERVLPVSAVSFYDDFLGAALASSGWGTRDSGAATEALVANAANGVVGLALDATNEIQVAGIDWGNQKSLILNQGLIFEARFRFAVLPTGSVVGCVGLSGDHNAAVDAVAQSIWFRADGNGVLTVETDDGTHETSKVATGITVTTADWVIVAIDCSDPANVQFFINGNRVADGTAFNMSATPSLALQPVARIGKESAATSVGTMQVDYVRAWQNRA
ncbi:MAG: LamG-like jellyroll fold domain-containing protein [Acetobacteraceae bacterium]